MTQDKLKDCNDYLAETKFIKSETFSERWNWKINENSTIIISLSDKSPGRIYLVKGEFEECEDLVHCKNPNLKLYYAFDKKSQMITDISQLTSTILHIDEEFVEDFIKKTETFGEMIDRLINN